MVGIMPKLFIFSGSVGVLDRKRILETCSKLHMHVHAELPSLDRLLGILMA